MADKHTTREYIARQFKNFKTYIDKIYLPTNKKTLDGFSESSEGGLLWNNEPIEGGGGGSSEAIDINYNNSTSGLDSENVQDAIDELDETIDDNKIQYEVEGTKLKIGGGFSVGSSMHEYSFEEQIVGKWIDGKPIYEKTFIGLNPELTSGNYIIPNSVINNLEEVIEMEGMTQNAGNDNAPLPYAFSGGVIWEWYNKTEGVHAATTYYNLVCHKIIVTVRYTKTTD